MPWSRRPSVPSEESAKLPEQWLGVGHGETEFLGEVEGFTVLRRATRAELYRVEEVDSVAFESPRLDEVFQLLLQHKLVGLQLGESMSFRFWLDPGIGRRGIDVSSAPLRWVVKIDEEPRGNELWYRAPHGRTGETLYARSVEALKTRIAREVARDVKAVRGGEIFPR